MWFGCLVDWLFALSFMTILYVCNKVIKDIYDLIYLHNVISGSLAARAVTLGDLQLAKEIHCSIDNCVPVLNCILSILVCLACSVFCIIFHFVPCLRSLIFLIACLR
jgi:hypothetical protein